MRGYQSLQKDSQSLQNPAEIRCYWNLAELKKPQTLAPACKCRWITEFLEKEILKVLYVLCGWWGEAISVLGFQGQ